ncbi:MAG: coiled-coil domain-containing protein, partial [Candidatus Odinarchaeota archaeon]
MVLGFNDDAKVFIDTQFPSNLSEFLGITPQKLKSLVENHMQRKMEPNYAELVLENEISIASFYTGFSFRHYVGKPNYAITVFLSVDDILSKDFEGMMRRIAYELLPKREALNFDDIFGRYYEMLKKEELTPYWEETVEGETSKVIVEIKDDKEPLDAEKEQVKDKTIEEIPTEPGGYDLLKEFEAIKDKNQELEDMLEEKTGKLRELTNKYTGLMDEKNQNSEQVEKLKAEVNEQYIKLEKWSQQMADLNENNAKLLENIKELNDNLSLRNDEIEVKEKKIDNLKKELESVEEFKKQTEKLIKEKEDLKRINLSLNAEIEKFASQIKKLEDQIEKSKKENSIHIDSITSLK